MSGRIIVGAIFIGLGFGVLLDQLDVIHFSQIISTWWPLILVIIGIVQLFSRTNSSVISGLIFIAVGIMFLLHTLFEMNVMKFMFPFIFIVVGLSIIFSKRAEKRQDISKRRETFALFAETNAVNNANPFTDSSVGAIFGSAKIDLREATFADASAEIETTAIFGNVTIMVPSHVRVEFTGVPILGSFEDKTRFQAADGEKVTLTCKSFIVFGSVEVIS